MFTPMSVRGVNVQFVCWVAGLRTLYCVFAGGTDFLTTDYIKKTPGTLWRHILFKEI